MRGHENTKRCKKTRALPTVRFFWFPHRIAHVTRKAGGVGQTTTDDVPRLNPESERARCPAGAGRGAARLGGVAVRAGASVYKRAPHQRRGGRRAGTPQRSGTKRKRAAFLLGTGELLARARRGEAVRLAVAERHELPARGRGGPRGGGRGAVRDGVVRLRRRVRRRRRGGPIPRRRRRRRRHGRGRGLVRPPGPPRVRAAAAEEDELGQHLRHDVHDVAAPSQKRAVAVLRGQVAVVRVHVGGALPGGPAQEGQPLQAEDQVVQELRRAGRDDGREAARLQLLRQPRPRRRQRVQDAAHSERVPPVEAAGAGRWRESAATAGTRICSSSVAELFFFSLFSFSLSFYLFCG